MPESWGAYKLQSAVPDVPTLCPASEGRQRARASQGFPMVGLAATLASLLYTGREHQVVSLIGQDGAERGSYTQHAKS